MRRLLWGGLTLTWATPPVFFWMVWPLGAIGVAMSQMKLRSGVSARASGKPGQSTVVIRMRRVQCPRGCLNVLLSLGKGHCLKGSLAAGSLFDPLDAKRRFLKVRLPCEIRRSFLRFTWCSAAEPKAASLTTGHTFLCWQGIQECSQVESQMK